MKFRSLISGLILVVLAAPVFAGAYFPSPPTAESVDGNIIVRWQTSVEINVKHFIVQRKSHSSDQFIDLAIIEPRPDKNYEYIDENVFKTEDNIYTYRIAIIDNDGQVTHSNSVVVSHSATVVKRTWGSIKALFR